MMNETNTNDNPTKAQTGVDAIGDLSELRLSQDFAKNVGVKKLLITVPVRKPTRQEFVRVHPDAGFRIPTPVLELKEENETYLVARDLWCELPGEIIPKDLFTAINRQGVLFIWPVRLPGEDGRLDHWSQTAATAAERAIDSWVRVASNRSLGAYDVFEAAGDLPDPIWPEATFDELLRIAFKDRFIDSLDHAVVQRLRGTT